LGILAGQPTDDSELALMLARSIVQNKGYDRPAALDATCNWYSPRRSTVGGHDFVGAAWRQSTARRRRTLAVPNSTPARSVRQRFADAN